MRPFPNSICFDLRQSLDFIICNIPAISSREVLINQFICEFIDPYQVKGATIEIWVWIDSFTQHFPGHVITYQSKKLVHLSKMDSSCHLVKKLDYVEPHFDTNTLQRYIALFIGV